MFLENYKKENIIYHSLLWCIFILLPLYISNNNSSIFKADISLIIIHLTSVLFSILLFYFNYLYAVPKLYYNHKRWKYLLSILISFFIIIYIGLFIINFTKNDHFNRLFYLKGFIIKLIFALIISFVVKLIQRSKQEEIEKKTSELNSLKSQINPHFLFNTLNGIYAQAIMKSESTANSIAKLSSIMRYVIDETGSDKVDIYKEIKYLTDYIELQKMRLTDNTQVIYKVNGDASKGEIQPLLFINFIDNAFKYGVSNERQTIISIIISINESHIDIIIENQIASTNTFIKKNNSTGLINAKKRLDLLFSTKYLLTMIESKDKYTVHLKIPIQ